MKITFTLTEQEADLLTSLIDPRAISPSNSETPGWRRNGIKLKRGNDPAFAPTNVLATGSAFSRRNTQENTSTEEGCHDAIPNAEPTGKEG
jgi:hypothetical protein